MKRISLIVLFLLTLFATTVCAQRYHGSDTAAPAASPNGTRGVKAACQHPALNVTAEAADGSIKLTLIDRRQNYNFSERETLDNNINSPKSVNISPDNSKFYVNSLEGATTVVYDLKTKQRLKVIKHQFDSVRDAQLWAPPSGLFKFTHYTDRNPNHFFGKPVEATFSHDGRYLWVPYYRRDFDINAQDPSAVAVIDTKTDEIIRLMETGPLPKMICTSPDDKYIAISHWGNNTVGLVNIESDDPNEWKYERVLVVDQVLPLNFPLHVSVDRDNNSGYALRGTVFTPDGHYLLVGCMGSGGGIAVIDMHSGKYLGRVTGMMPNVRHLVIFDHWLYLSVNAAGMVQRMDIGQFIKVAQTMNGESVKTAQASGWENAKVGAGARTIELSPDGRFVFAACNLASRICVVDTRTMRQVLEIPADSYPVGLAISCDGHYLISTSQGRNHVGGNCVDIYRIDYKEEPVIPVKAERDTTVVATNEEPGSLPTTLQGAGSWTIGGIVALLIILLTAFGIYCKRKKE